MTTAHRHPLGGPLATLALVTALAGAVATATLASDDHDEARLLRERGDIMPLAELLRHPSLASHRVLEAELEYEHGRLVYELEVLEADGRIREHHFDAATGEPLR
jgi:uncharacterized membrane protein YkoI